MVFMDVFTAHNRKKQLNYAILLIAAPSLFFLPPFSTSFFPPRKNTMCLIVTFNSGILLFKIMYYDTFAQLFLISARASYGCNEFNGNRLAMPLQ